jgi:hypothetical protein
VQRRQLLMKVGGKQVKLPVFPFKSGPALGDAAFS